MAANPLFSTYRGGENRVTSSIMAVFERIDLALVRDILAASAGAGDELRAVTFENQIVTPGAVPDARISGQFTWWFETKTVRGGYAAEGHDRAQLRSHADLLDEDQEAILFVLTPDPIRPPWFDDLDEERGHQVASRIIWISFRSMATAMDEIASDPTRLLGEQTRFLFAELIQMFEVDGLLTNDDTVIVAARRAWPEYLETGAYICQPGRSFREGLTHLGFYANGAIQTLIPRIRGHHPSLQLTVDEAARLRGEGDGVVADLLEKLIDQGTRAEGESYGIFLLSRPGENETVKLDEPIANDKKLESGANWAWTLSQRYTELERLRSGARLTSQL